MQVVELTLLHNCFTSVININSLCRTINSTSLKVIIRVLRATLGFWKAYRSYICLIYHRDFLYILPFIYGYFCNRAVSCCLVMINTAFFLHNRIITPNNSTHRASCSLINLSLKEMVISDIRFWHSLP